MIIARSILTSAVAWFRPPIEFQVSSSPSAARAFGPRGFFLPSGAGFDFQSPLLFNGIKQQANPWSEVRMLRTECGACQHWHSLDDPSKSMFGTCRVRPPAMANHDLEQVLEQADFPLDVMAMNRWPVTAASDLCGKFDWRCRWSDDCRDSAYPHCEADRRAGRIGCERHLHLMRREPPAVVA